MTPKGQGWGAGPQAFVQAKAWMVPHPCSQLSGCGRVDPIAELKAALVSQRRKNVTPIIGRRKSPSISPPIG
jgi:hypothetical protein